MCFSTFWSFSMKKTLVALAVLAAGAASAQVTITGGYTFGYASDSFKTAATAASTATGNVGGLYTDGAGLKATATEDLGNGISATASVSAGGFVRGSAVNGEDASLSLSGGFGTVKLTSMESGAGANFGNLSGGYGLDGQVFGGNTTKDRVYYVLPKMGDLAAQVYYTDQSTAAGTAGGGGTQGSSTATATTFAVDYTIGAALVGGSYTVYGNKQATTADSALGLKASYDAGVAKVAIALDKTNGGAADKAVYGLGASFPMGALTLGVGYGNNQNNDNTRGKSKTGTVLGASYALSKTTSVAASYRTLSNNDSSFRVLASKSF
jgi:predicted porin